MTSRWQGTPYFSKYGRELVCIPAISLKLSGPILIKTAVFVLLSLGPLQMFSFIASLPAIVTRRRQKVHATTQGNELFTPVTAGIIKSLAAQSHGTSHSCTFVLAHKRTGRHQLPPYRSTCTNRSIFPKQSLSPCQHANVYIYMLEHHC